MKWRTMESAPKWTGILVAHDGGVMGHCVSKAFIGRDDTVYYAGSKVLVGAYAWAPLPDAPDPKDVQP